MNKYFVLIVNYASGKKGAFPTNCADLASALIEFKNAQIKSMQNILMDKSSVVLPEITSAEIIRVVSLN